MAQYCVNVTRTITFTATVIVNAKNEDAACEKVNKLGEADKLGAFSGIDVSKGCPEFDSEWELDSDTAEADDAYRYEP